MIRLLVDSASDISINNENNIKVIPLSVTINDKTYLDQYELGHNEFYEMLTTTETFPKTSQPAPQAYVEAFEEVKEAGDDLLCILLSSGVSGTYQSAVLAKSIVEYDNIYIVDSLTGAYGVKLLVDEALKMIDEGKTIQEIVNHLEDLKNRTRIYLSVDTLDYLCRGGRLDKKSAIIGNLVKMKPIITVTREGTIGVVGKAVGMIRAMGSIIDIINDEEVDTNHAFYTIYTAGTTNVEKLEKKITNNGITITERVQLSPVVGTHLGPEAFGVIYITKK